MTPELPRGPVPANPCARPLPTAAGCSAHGVRLESLDSVFHSSALFAASHGSPEVEALWTYMGYGPFSSAAQMQAWLKAATCSSDPDFMVVIDESIQEPVGMVSYLNLAPEMGRLEVGHIWYGPTHQRGHVNTATLYLLLREAFDACSYRRVEWKCDSLNERSRAAALRLGFQFEGLFRQHLIVKGHNRDTVWFSMLDSEWPRVRAGLERWLEWPGADRPHLRDLTS